jgi:predicted NBD/HSP70 family sugar kinase
VAEDFSPAEVDHAPTESLDLAHELVRASLRGAGIEPGRVLGVGMGLAAPIHKATGEIATEGILPGWHGIRPAHEMQARLGVAVELENDANVGALGEKVFGAARGVDDLIYVRVSAGIGAGLILGGRPYRGFGGVAGEIGHVLADPAGPICRCGNRGCLETIASPPAVAALLERSSGEPVAVEQLLELVEAKDRRARRAVADAGEAIGRALSMLVNVLNPELVVVGGDLAPAGPVLLDPIRAAIERHGVAPAAGAVRVMAGTLGDRAEVLGAAGLILAQSPHALATRVEK